MRNNIFPPFMIRESGIEVHERPKIQVKNPIVDDHLIYLPETGFQIMISLWGMFLYFITSRPTEFYLMETEGVYMLTPSVWNPHCCAYTRNEETMIDWEGNMI